MTTPAPVFLNFDKNKINRAHIAQVYCVRALVPKQYCVRVHMQGDLLPLSWCGHDKKWAATIIKMLTAP